jgi:hypothetical protein
MIRRTKKQIEIEVVLRHCDKCDRNLSDTSDKESREYFFIDRTLDGGVNWVSESVFVCVTCMREFLGR